MSLTHRSKSSNSPDARRREGAELAKALIGQAVEQQQIGCGQLTPTMSPR